MTAAAPEYIAARRTLLDALDALAAHRHSMVLIGAQAIYLHTGSHRMNVAPMRTDADLAFDVDLLSDDPEIAETMESAGFTPGEQPGHWENVQGVAVDLMVAPHQSNRPSPTARSADLKPHAKKVARIGPGLAPGLADNSLHVIAALDPADTRQHEVRVAGPAALLIAKTIKIDDRLSDATRGKSQRVVDKDALDVLRLLQAFSTDQLASGLTSHDTDTPAHADAARALTVLRERATESRHDLPLLATRAAGDDPTVAPSFAFLTGELLKAVA